MTTLKYLIENSRTLYDQHKAEADKISKQID